MQFRLRQCCMHSPPIGGAQAKVISSDEAHVSPTQVRRCVFNGTQVDPTENKKLDGLALACTCPRKHESRENSKQRNSMLTMKSIRMQSILQVSPEKNSVITKSTRQCLPKQNPQCYVCARTYKCFLKHRFVESQLFSHHQRIVKKYKHKLE